MVLQLKSEITEALHNLAHKFRSSQYCIRGTTSLVLQGIDMNIEDIDILCNAESALKANELLSEYCVFPVEYKETVKFKSYFGTFTINGVKVEIMGDWQIKDKNGKWSEVFDGSEFNTVSLNDIDVRVTKIEDELKMFLLMGRFTAYQKIKHQLPLQEKNIVQNSNQPDLFGHKT